MAVRKISLKTGRRLKKNSLYNGLPTRVTTLESGDYECNINEFSEQETKFGKSIVVTLESRLGDKKVTFKKYFNLNYGIISGSELYTFLESMNAISDDKIFWSKIKDASVIATIEVGNDAKPKVKKLTPANSNSTDEPAEGYDEFDEEEEDDEEYDEEE